MDCIALHLLDYIESGYSIAEALDEFLDERRHPWWLTHALPSHHGPLAGWGHPIMGHLYVHGHGADPEDFADFADFGGEFDGGDGGGDGGMGESFVFEAKKKPKIITKTTGTLSIGANYKAIKGQTGGGDRRSAKRVRRRGSTVNIGATAKSAKGQNKRVSSGFGVGKKGILTAVMHFAPHGYGGVPDYCRHSSPGCRKNCIFHSGRMGLSQGKAQVERTKRFAANPKQYVDELTADIGKLKNFSHKKGYALAVRLNGTSDLDWERIVGTNGTTPIEDHEDVMFYDYTKDHDRVHANLSGEHPANYHLTYSLKADEPESFEHADRIMKRGGNVAVPFDVDSGADLPKTWRGRKVLDGDDSDHRFHDPMGGHWIGLPVKVAKTPLSARSSASGGYVRNADHNNPEDQFVVRDFAQNP